MHHLNRHFVYMPSQGTIPAIHTEYSNQNSTQYYTLSYTPGKPDLSIEQIPEERNTRIKPFDIFVKDFLHIVEDDVADGRKNTHPEQRLERYHGYLPNHMKWERRKVKVAEIGPDFTKVRTRIMTAYSPMGPQPKEVETAKEKVHVLNLTPFLSSTSVLPSCSGQVLDDNDQSKFNNMTSAEMHEYFNQKMADFNKYYGGKFGDEGGMRERGKDRRLYGEEKIYGNQFPENPDTVVYDTDSPMEN